MFNSRIESVSQSPRLSYFVSVSNHCVPRLAQAMGQLNDKIADASRREQKIQTLWGISEHQVAEMSGSTFRSYLYRVFADDNQSTHERTKSTKCLFDVFVQYIYACIYACIIYN